MCSALFECCEYFIEPCIDKHYKYTDYLWNFQIPIYCIICVQSLYAISIVFDCDRIYPLHYLLYTGTAVVVWYYPVLYHSPAGVLGPSPACSSCSAHSIDLWLSTVPVLLLPVLS